MLVQTKLSCIKGLNLEKSPHWFCGWGHIYLGKLRCLSCSCMFHEPQETILIWDYQPRISKTPAKTCWVVVHLDYTSIAPQLQKWRQAPSMTWRHFSDEIHKAWWLACLFFIKAGTRTSPIQNTFQLVVLKDQSRVGMIDDEIRDNTSMTGISYFSTISIFSLRNYVLD